MSCFDFLPNLEAMERKVSKGGNEKCEFYSYDGNVAIQAKATKKTYAAIYINGNMIELPNAIGIFQELKKRYEKEQEGR